MGEIKEQIVKCDQHIEKAKRELQEYLLSKHPDFHTLSYEQAVEVLSINTLHIWHAWKSLMEAK